MTDRANEIAEQLSMSDIANAAAKIDTPSEAPDFNEAASQQALSLGGDVSKREQQAQKAACERILETDMTHLTPMEAFFLLNELQEKLKK